MDYRKLGLTEADAPELLRMAMDERLLGLAIQEEDAAAWPPSTHCVPSGSSAPWRRPRPSCAGPLSTT
jgi:hypothetical protein